MIDGYLLVWPIKQIEWQLRPMKSSAMDKQEIRICGWKARARHRDTER